MRFAVAVRSRRTARMHCPSHVESAASMVAIETRDFSSRSLCAQLSRQEVVHRERLSAPGGAHSSGPLAASSIRMMSITLVETRKGKW